MSPSARSSDDSVDSVDRESDPIGRLERALEQLGAEYEPPADAPPLYDWMDDKL